MNHPIAESPNYSIRYRTRALPARPTRPARPASGSRIDPFNPRTTSTHDFPRNRADGRRHFARVNTIVALRSENHRVVTREHFQARDIHREHVHADGTDHRRAATANQHMSSTRESKVDAVGV